MLSVETALLQATQVAARALLSLAFSLGIFTNPRAAPPMSALELP